MVLDYFVEGLQAYLAPLIALGLFIFFIIRNDIFDKSIKRLFVFSACLTILLIAATWADSVLRVCDFRSAWFMRSITSCINFAFSPFVPAALVSIYKSEKEVTTLFYAPLALNVAMCVISVFTGWIFSIDANNSYSRGLLFVFPFVITAFYMGSLLYFSLNQSRPGKRAEMTFLMAVTAATVAAYGLEIWLGGRYMIWSVTTVCIILYYSLLSIQMVIFEPLTGAYSRMAFDKTLPTIDGRHSCVITVIDINNLKTINDTCGHIYGDELIKVVAAELMKSSPRRTKLYRTGGDEFIMISMNNNADSVEYTLELILKEKFSRAYSENLGIISFAYGSVDYKSTKPLQEALDAADARMYERKKAMKEAMKKK